MGRFIVHGIITEEPRRFVFKSGVEKYTVTLEERIRYRSKERVSLITVDFMGKSAECLPVGSVAGSMAIVVGDVVTIEGNGKNYIHLYADGITIVGASDAKAMDSAEEGGQAPAQALGANEEANDEDLPF